MKLNLPMQGEDIHVKVKLFVVQSQLNLFYRNMFFKMKLHIKNRQPSNSVF